MRSSRTDRKIFSTAMTVDIERQIRAHRHELQKDHHQMAFVWQDGKRTKLSRSFDSDLREKK